MKTISFYSFKGGVGRTLALAYTAVYLARNNFKICIIDADLEAPGVMYKFDKNFDTSKKGLVDYIYSCIKEKIVPEDIIPYLHTYKEEDWNGFIKIISAGKNIDKAEYFNKLNRLNMDELFIGNENEGTFLFDKLRDQIEVQVNPDYLFIDSRSGVTTMGKACNSVLPDIVVMLLANNKENRIGSKIIYNHIVNSDYKLIEENIHIICALTRIPLSDRITDQKESQAIESLVKEMDSKKLDVSDVIVIHSDSDLEYEETTILHPQENENRYIFDDYWKLLEKIVDAEFLIEKQRMSISLNESKYSFLESDIKEIVRDNLKIYININTNKNFYKKFKYDAHTKPRSCKAMYMLALAEAYKNNVFEAMRILSKAIRIGDKNDTIWLPKIFHFRGILFLYVFRNYNDAYYDFCKINSDYKKHENNFFYDFVYCLMCQDRYDESIEYADKILLEKNDDLKIILLKTVCKARKYLDYDFVRGKSNKGKLTISTANDVKTKRNIIDDFTKIIDLNVNNEVAYANRGVLYYEIGEKERALCDYNRAIEINPNYEFAYRKRGIYYADKKEHQNALLDYDEAIKINPRYCYAYNSRGCTYDDLGKTEEAFNDFKKAIELNPDYDMAYNNLGVAYKNNNEKDKALYYYTKAIDINPDCELAYRNRGQLYFDMGENEKALVDFNKAKKINPDSDVAYRKRGNAYYSWSEIEKAISDYDKVIELNPYDKFVHHYRGNLFFKIGEKEKAISDYNKAIELNPNSETYIERGRLYLRLGDKNKAFNDYTKAIDLEPSSAFVYAERAMAYNSIGGKEEALNDFSKAIEIDRSYIFAYVERARLYTNLGEKENALVDLNKLIELAPNDAFTYTERGNFYNNEDEKEKALSDYNKAIEVNGDYKFAYSMRGDIYIKLSEDEKALADYNKAIEIDPSYERVYIKRGDLYVTLNNKEKALADYNRVIEINPNSNIAKNSKWLLHSGNILRTYNFPVNYRLSEDYYEFALIEKHEKKYLTDQGKTYKMLEKIFELTEPDVIKNLVRVLEEFSVIKLGNEFVIEILNRDSATTETDEIRDAKYRLFCCVSFMNKIYIFYMDSKPVDIAENNKFSISSMNTLETKEEDESYPSPIDKCQFPRSYYTTNILYEFVLVRIGEKTYISDQGRTYEMLDKIFELDKSDVLKNLNAIMKECQVIQMGTKFLVEMSSSENNYSAKIDENARSKYQLLECVSFMDTMHIFFV